MKVKRIYVNGEWVAGEPTINEQVYRIYHGPNTNSAYIELKHYTEHSPVEYTAGNISVQVIPTGTAIPVAATTGATSNDFHIIKGQSIIITCEIQNQLKVKQTQVDSSALSYPPLVLPVVKTGDNGNIVLGEEYLTTTLVAGVATITGNIPDSGNWKIKEANVNKALKAIGADWKIDFPTTTFYVPST